MQDRQKWDDTVKVLDGKTVNQQFYIQQNDPSKMKVK